MTSTRKPSSTAEAVRLNVPKTIPLPVVCLLLAVAVELLEGKKAFHKGYVQKNSRRSHFQVTKRQSECSSDQFLCVNSSRCISNEWVCDSENDCYDGSDEPEDCLTRDCPEGYVKCSNGQCLNKRNYCNGDTDTRCRDGALVVSDADCLDTEHFSTAVNFTCPPEDSYFQCQSNGECISNSSRCDGFYDCDDGSDEADCPPLQCDPGYARCPTSDRCIKIMYFCDTDNDCDDNSDEQNCEERVCADDEVRCNSGQCRNKLSFCLSSSSCRDGSDPDGACLDFTCPPADNYFQCLSSGKCISNSSLCDDYTDCADGSDEADCSPVQCDSGFARCPTSNTRCIDTRDFCDFDNDCDDNSDESPEFCMARECPEGNLKCSSGQCINKTSYCLGDASCRGEAIVVSDADCQPAQCRLDQFACASLTRCISRIEVCDLQIDCGDWSDEQNCEERVCEDDEVRCISGQCLSKLPYCGSRSSCRDRSTPSGACLDFTCPLNGNYFQCLSSGRCISNSSRCDGYTDCADKSDEADCPPVQCDSGFARCLTSNTKCIDTRYFCDLENDCDDNSDESPDICNNRHCEEDEFSCASGQCLKKDEFCRGEFSCRDNSRSTKDVSICPPRQCDRGSARCPNGSRCINTRYFCDTDNDCGDNSDEAPELCSGRVCQDDEITCANGQCIPTDEFCREDFTCRDESRFSNDSTLCKPIDCESGYSKCPNRNKCIRSRFICDSDNDCGDNSDEAPELCNDRQCEEDEVSCANGQCLMKYEFCQGEYSCRDNSRSTKDVSICPPVQCDIGSARCPNNNKCIKTRYFCDTDNDCGDNSDEAPELCSDRVCQDDEITCANGQCIPIEGFCREDFTCRDESRFSNDSTLCRVGGGATTTKPIRTTVPRSASTTRTNGRTLTLTNIITLKGQFIYATARIDDELFVLRVDGPNLQSQVIAYNMTTLNPIRYSNNFSCYCDGLAVGPINNRLYFGDWTKLHVLDSNTLQETSGSPWSLPSGSYAPSVNSEHNLLIPTKNGDIYEYTLSGVQVRKISTGIGTAVYQAVEGCNGTLVITLPMANDVRLISVNGTVLRSYGTGKLNNPRGIAVDKNGFVLVAECWGSRFLALDPTLTSSSVVKLPVGTASQIACQWGLSFDESRGRLYVAEGSSQGRVLIFDNFLSISDVL